MTPEELQKIEDYIPITATIDIKKLIDEVKRCHELIKQLNTPTKEQIFDRDYIKVINKKVLVSTKYGEILEEICYRKIDNTYWSIKYTINQDGLKEDDTFTIDEVVPKETTILQYVLKGK